MVKNEDCPQTSFMISGRLGDMAECTDRNADTDTRAAKEQRAQAAATVDRLEKAVRDDVARWNELNPGYRRRLDDVKKLMPSGAFRVSRSSFPPFAIDIVLDPESFCVNVETTTMNPVGGEQYIQQSYFVLAIEKGTLCLTREPGEAISFTAASRAVLEPIIPSSSFWARR
jgi:hypothetical protein